jgi:hypothetical protein
MPAWGCVAPLIFFDWMIRTDTTTCSSFVHLVAEIFRRREVGIRLWSGALLLLLDLVLVVAFSCLIWFGWPPCSYSLAVLLLLLISFWCSSKWPWSLVAWAGIFGMVCLSVLEVWIRWWVKWMVWVVWCGYLCDVYVLLVQNSVLPSYLVK